MNEWMTGWMYEWMDELTYTCFECDVVSSRHLVLFHHGYVDDSEGVQNAEEHGVGGKRRCANQPSPTSVGLKRIPASVVFAGVEPF